MPENDDRMTPPRSFWAIAGGSLLWNLIGVMNYLYSVTLSPEALAALILPIIILALAGFFLWYSRRVTAHGLLN
jgi:hypothetical protein